MKTLIFSEDARKVIRAFPKDVRQAIGQALRMAQEGEKHPSAKPLAGFGGAGVIEIVERSADGTYRVVYATVIKNRVYALHAFKKKSKSGIATPKFEIDLIGQQLREIRDASKWLTIGTWRRNCDGEGAMSKKRTETPAATWVESSGNVFADLGLPNPELAQLKADIAIAIHKAIERKGITQREAGDLMGIPAVKVSNIVCGRLKGYSLDRLFTYLKRLDVDVQVRMKPKSPRRDSAEIRGVHA